MKLAVALALSLSLGTPAFAKSMKYEKIGKEEIYGTPSVAKMAKKDVCALEALQAAASGVIADASERGVDWPDAVYVVSIKHHPNLDVFLIDTDGLKFVVGVTERGTRKCKVTEAELQREDSEAQN